MLSKLQQEGYKNALTHLMTLQEQLEKTDSSFLLIQTTWQQVIQRLEQEELNLNDTPRLQSIQTEIQRSVRLLTTEMLFLQSSRQNATRQQRLTGIRDRVAQLITYCQEMIK